MQRLETEHGSVEFVTADGGRDARQEAGADLYRRALEQFFSGQTVESEILCRQALSFDSNNANALHLLGVILCQAGDLSASLELLQRALGLRPNEAAFHNSLGIVLKRQGRFESAVDQFSLALALCPDLADAHHNLGMLMLLKGDLRTGWTEHEWRLHSEEGRRKNALAPFPHPRWDGRAFLGKTLLVQAEQGLGDTVQFARYLAKAKARGGRVIFLCQSELLRLFERLTSIDELVPKTDEALNRLIFDIQVPLLSFPAIFGTTLDTIPREVPYLKADPERIAMWRTLLPQTGYHVGIVWAGSATHGNDRNRSCPIEAFLPLAQVPGIVLHSLQKGPAAQHLKEVPPEFKVVDWCEKLHDFADTAALIECLDLVISVDTAVVHLAGALGKPVWVLLPFVPDWRWMLERADSPWYPTARLFRQPAIGDWEAIVAQVKGALATSASSRRLNTT